MLSGKRLRKAATGALLLAAAAVSALTAFRTLDHAFPPPLPARIAVGKEVVDRDGALLRAFATPDGKWRLATNLDAVDPHFVEMLIAYEDKRFYDHSGIDALALLRAAGQFAANGRIVSGGSTLSMQLARLIEPRQGRSLSSKLLQLARAVQIERRLSKLKILERYLMLAPYGGNLEGIRAASLAYFGKEPKRLSVSDSAMLVALPQLPERRRPDRHPKTAKAARDRVLARMVTAGRLGEREAARAALEPAAEQRLAMPALAAHLSQDAVRQAPLAVRYQLSVSKELQDKIEAVATDAATKLDRGVSVALLLADARTGDVLAHVGSPDFFDAGRSGWIDMTRATRSPGSTLKPFIYGLAFEQGLIAQETMIEDRPASFGGYRPKNFDMTYQGDVSVRQALQLSLNVPAVRLLEAVGPARLAARFRRAGVTPLLPAGETPGLAIALGGVGVSLHDLVQLYTGLANGGKARALRDGATPDASGVGGEVLDPIAAWQVGDILSGVGAPEGAAPRAIAYKTGTSYGYRDAWAIGFDGRHVLGVWVGRPDSGAAPGLSGYGSAAPILFEAFAKSGLAVTPLRRAPAGALRTARGELPVTLERFSLGEDGLIAAASAPTEPPPQIIFPPQGARVDLGPATEQASPLVLKLQGGRAPFRWLANGKPLAALERRRTASWTPDGVGASTLTVIDAAGRAASVSVFVE